MTHMHTVGRRSTSSVKIERLALFVPVQNLVELAVVVQTNPLTVSSRLALQKQTMNLNLNLTDERKRFHGATAGVLSCP